MSSIDIAAVETVVVWAASMAVVVGGPLMVKRTRECRRSRIRIRVRHLATVPAQRTGGEPR
jgi:hypothetical protein